MPFFRYAYQPIVSARHGRVFGYEALCRPQPALAGSVEEMLETARRAGWQPDLGALMRDTSTEVLERMSDDLQLFINVHPVELDADLVSWARTRADLVDRIVLEVTEGAAILKGSSAHRAVRELQEMGFRFAVDDLGAGYASLRTLTFLDPRFIKLDQEMIRDVSENARTQSLLMHLASFAAEEGILVVAEGVETRAQFDTVRMLGVDLLQGFWIGRPAAAEAMTH